MTDLRLAANQPIRICGHRGNMRHAPENTLAALRSARDGGATACEIDVRLTADGRLVLMHDITLERTTNGTGLVRAHTLSEIAALDAGSWFGARFAGEPVPTLEAALKLTRELSLILRIELKDWHDDDLLFPALRGALSIEPGAPFVVCSFDHRQLLALKATLPQVRTMGITHGRPADLPAIARAARLDGLSVQTPALADDDIQALHEAGLALSCYCPINEQLPPERSSLGKLRRWAYAGWIDMITVDDVNWLGAQLKNADGRPPAP